MAAVIKLKTSGREYMASHFYECRNYFSCNIAKNGKPFGSTRTFAPDEIELIIPGEIGITTSSREEHYRGNLLSIAPVRIEITQKIKYAKF